MSKYTIDYFIDKFTNIPEDNFTSCGQYINQEDSSKMCALGHCGYRSRSPGVGFGYGTLKTNEGLALDKLLNQSAPYVNDGIEGGDKYGTTPKERILNALNEVKSNGKFSFSMFVGK